MLNLFVPVVCGAWGRQRRLVLLLLLLLLLHALVVRYGPAQPVHQARHDAAAVAVAATAAAVEGGRWGL